MPKLRIFRTQIAAFGQLAADNRHALALSLPQAGRIIAAQVLAGQRVKHGDALLKFETDPATRSAYLQARNAWRTARDGLARSEHLHAEKLATNTQLDAAREALADAEAALAAQVFTLLLFLYESFRTAIVVLIQPLLAMCGVFTGLWITGTELDISSMMGMTMIVGIVTELAIFYFSELAEIEAQDHSDSAPSLRVRLLEAGRRRTRAILMSTIAAILTLSPLALAVGRGAQMQQPLAIAIIAGMLTAVPLVLVLVAMPTLYLLAMRHKSS